LKCRATPLLCAERLPGRLEEMNPLHTWAGDSSWRSSLGSHFRKNRWMLPGITVTLGLALAAGVLLHTGGAVVLSLCALLAVSCFSWGYLERYLVLFPWPALNEYQRGEYAQVWDAMADSPENALRAVCGQTTEEEVRASAAEPIADLVDLISTGVNDDVLEIACGVARIGRELAPRCRSWTGADRSPNMLRFAAARLDGGGKTRLVQLRRSGLSDLPDCAYDVVYCINSMAHMDEIDHWRYLRDSLRVLRPGGRILFENLNLKSPQGWKAFVELEHKYRDAAVPSYMTRFSTPEELVEYAARAGFELIRTDEKGVMVILTAAKPASTRP